MEAGSLFAGKFVGRLANKESDELSNEKQSKDSIDRSIELGIKDELLLVEELSFEMKSDSELGPSSDLETEETVLESEPLPKYARYEGTWLFWTEVGPERISISELELVKSIKEVESVVE